MRNHRLTWSYARKGYFEYQLIFILFSMLGKGISEYQLIFIIFSMFVKVILEFQLIFILFFYVWKGYFGMTTHIFLYFMIHMYSLND